MTRRTATESSEIKPLSRRLSLRIRCARPEHVPGQEKKNKQEETLTLPWIAALAASARFWRTLVDVKRQFLVNQPSSLERGSAATRTVVRSISQVARPDELTHISRINRR